MRADSEIELLRLRWVVENAYYMTTPKRPTPNELRAGSRRQSGSAYRLQFDYGSLVPRCIADIKIHIHVDAVFLTIVQKPHAQFRVVSLKCIIGKQASGQKTYSHIDR